MGSPTLPAAADLFPCTVSQAHLLPQLSIARCLSPDGTFDMDKYQQYATSLLARAQSQSAAIRSSMVGGGESHAGFVGQEVTLHSFKKMCAKRCVLGRKDTEDGPLCVITPQKSSCFAHMFAIIYWMMQTHLWQRSSGIGFVYLTIVTRISLLKSNLTIGSSIGVGSKPVQKKSPIELLLLTLFCHPISHNCPPLLSPPPPPNYNMS